MFVAQATDSLGALKNPQGDANITLLLKAAENPHSVGGDRGWRKRRSFTSDGLSPSTRPLSSPAQRRSC